MKGTLPDQKEITGVGSVGVSFFVCLYAYLLSIDVYVYYCYLTPLALIGILDEKSFGNFLTKDGLHNFS